MPSITFRRERQGECWKTPSKRGNRSAFSRSRNAGCSRSFPCCLRRCLWPLQRRFIKPFRWKRLLWTYLIPLVPLMCCWDGVISQLRAYTIAELSELTQGLEDYEWSAGNTPIDGQPGHLTYLLGAT